MIRGVLLACGLACGLLVYACGGDEKISPASGTLHLIPFRCTYLGIEISELDGCSIACPGRILEEYDITQLSSFLTCSHPDYRFLRCGVSTR